MISSRQQVQTLSDRSIETIAGRGAVSTPFGSEASLLALAAEQVIVFGPGDMQTAHSSRDVCALERIGLSGVSGGLSANF